MMPIEQAFIVYSNATPIMQLSICLLDISILFHCLLIIIKLLCCLAKEKGEEKEKLVFSLFCLSVHYFIPFLFHFIHQLLFGVALARLRGKTASNPL